MDIQLFAKTFFEVIEQINPHLKSVVDTGASLYTIGSAGVKILQQGKQLVTYAVGKVKKKPASKKDKPKIKSKNLEPKELIQKADVAIVVEISRPSVQDVVNYLNDKKIDANLVIITTVNSHGSKPIKGLSENRPGDWTEVVQEFSAAIDKVKSEVGAKRIHIFLSTPLPLAFGLGAVWGTVDQAYVYHWKKNGSYAPLMRINRNLRFQE